MNSKMNELEEKIARIYAREEGFDPDSVHFDHKMVEYKLSNGGHKTKLELVDTGKKKYELYIGRARANIEIFKLLLNESKNV